MHPYQPRPDDTRNPYLLQSLERLRHEARKHGQLEEMLAALEWEVAE